MHPEHLRSEVKHQGMRDAIYDFLSDRWEKELGVPVTLRPIDEAALDQAEQVWSASRGANCPEIFDWADIHQQLRSTPRRLDLAIWNNGRLAGLTTGRASHGSPERSKDSNVTLHFMQAAPAAMVGALRGSVAPIALDTAIAYATLLGHRAVYLRSPVPSVVPYYEAFGFSIVKRSKNRVYMGKNI